MLAVWERLSVWLRAFVVVLLLAGTGLTIWFWPTGADIMIEPPASDVSGTARPNHPRPTAPPAMPAEATANTPEGAKAFTRHFFAVMAYSDQTGDTKILKQLFDASQCRQCLLIVSAIEEINKKGNNLYGGEYSISGMQTGPLENGYLVIVQYERSAAEIRDDHGKAIEEIKEVNKSEAAIELKRNAQSWLVVSINKVK